jgi:hypothetical protein
MRKALTFWLALLGTASLVLWASGGSIFSLVFGGVQVVLALGVWLDA